MSWITSLTEALESGLDKRIGDLSKIESKPADVTGSVTGSLTGSEPLEKRIKEDGTLGRKGLIFDPYFAQGSSGGMFRPRGAGGGFISPHILKIVSRRDPIASCIIHTRAGQSSSFSKKPQDRFDTGYKIKTVRKTEETNDQELEVLDNFISKCGLDEGRSEEDKMPFSEFAYAITCDLLTYGHCAIERIYAQDGSLHSFAPLPAETIFIANKQPVAQSATASMVNAASGVLTALTGENHDSHDDGTEEYAYVQVINGQVVQGFSRDDLIFAKINTQNDIDLMGYAHGPLEKAISMVTAHLQIENHQKMFFTHGVASKGLLVIQGDITPNQLRTLQAQWTNQVTGPASAWRTPILAGIKGVQWQPLTMGSRDMEYAAYQDHVLRVIHAVFAIDPEETGFGYLSKGTEQRSMGEANNEWKVTASRDKGLRPILGRIEAIMNDEILPRWNPQLANQYEFKFVGLDAETRGEETQRIQAEVSLHTTLDEARKEAELEPLPVGGGLILNPILVQTLQSNLYKGVFMEYFLGVKGASQRPDLQYIPDPFWFQWMQFQMGMMQQQQGGDPDQEDEDQDGDQGDEKSSDGDKKQDKGDKGDKKPPAKKSSDKKSSANDKNKQNVDNQAKAVDKFIQANPELFKAMGEALEKSAEIRKVRVDDSHVDKLVDHLCNDFEHGADKMVKEIMEAVAQEMRELGREGSKK